MVCSGKPNPGCQKGEPGQWETVISKPTCCWTSLALAYFYSLSERGRIRRGNKRKVGFGTTAGSVGTGFAGGDSGKKEKWKWKRKDSPSLFPLGLRLAVAKRAGQGAGKGTEPVQL